MSAFYCNLGLMDYREAYGFQTRLVDMRRAGDLAHDLFLITEHPSVYTLGKRGGREHLVVSDAFLQERQIDIVPIERGGVITYHGPGQLIIYPIIHLKEAKLAVKDYVYGLEEVMTLLAGKVGIETVRDERNHGVWVGNKKMGSVGIAIRHGVSFHGLALNVNPDMAPFRWINPCGLSGVSMTSLALESGMDISLPTLSGEIPGIFEEVFNREFNAFSKEQLAIKGVRN